MEKKKLKIIDLDGKPMEVADLDASIATTLLYSQYEHEDSGYEEFDKKMREYWTDVHEKLLKLKKI